jgi:glycosyltransferase involved in cell wall biosynthesis
MPVLTIAMPVHNGESTVERAIRSLALQSFQDWELLLLDDGSTDQTYEICRSFSDKRVRVLHEKQKRGLAARLNQAIDLAKGEYFARADADDVSFSERLKLQINFLVDHPDIDLTGGQMLLVDNAQLPIGIQSCPLNHEDIVRRPWNVVPMWHPTWCGRSSWFKKYRYDASLLRSQDQDLLLRALPESKFANVPHYLVGYRAIDLSTPKAFLSRSTYAKVLWKNALRSLDIRFALHSAAYLAGAIPVLYRLRRLLNKGVKSLGKVPDDVFTQWNQLNLQLGVRQGR